MLGQLPWTAFALGGTKGVAAFGISGVPGALGVGGVGEGSRYPVHTGSGAPRSFAEHPGEPLVLAR